MTPGRWLLRILGVFVAIAIAAGLWWLRPAPAEDVSLAVIDTPPEGIAVAQSRSQLTLTPTAATPTKGFIFYPGGLVDPRAYANILAPIAQAGYLVAVPKMPFDLAITDISAARSIIKAHPDVTWWAAGGHSLGGVAASSFVAGSANVPGLALWASIPLSDLSDLEDLSVLSVSGSNDDLTTPADIAESVPRLPSTAQFVTVDGSVHAFFGDYGEQRGDGDPQIDRAEAQAQITAATVQWLNTASATP